MSITSVGASFGYIDPSTVAGAQSVQSSNTTDDDSSSNNAGNPAATASPTNTPPPAPPQTTSFSGPKLAPETGSALMTVQEKANAA